MAGMAAAAAPGRESIFEDLLSVENQIHDILTTWHRGIANYHVQTTPRYSFVTTWTSLREALVYLSSQAQNINERWDMLQQLGIPIDDDDEPHIDLSVVLRPALEDRKGSETAGWALLKTLPRIEQMNRNVCDSLRAVEGVLNKSICDLLEAIEALIECNELSEEVQEFCGLKWRAESLRGDLAEAGSQDAVWLDPLKEELRILEAVFDDECPSAKELSKCITKADVARMSLFRHAAVFGVKIQRQTLLTEYFEPVSIQ